MMLNINRCCQIGSVAVWSAYRFIRSFGCVHSYVNIAARRATVSVDVREVSCPIVASRIVVAVVIVVSLVPRLYNCSRQTDDVRQVSPTVTKPIDR